MSNTTKLALEASLKKLLLKKPVDKITINDLTEDCGISRMAFYYHFKDIYDLIEWACLEDGKRALADKKTYSTWSEGLEQIFEAVLENKPFILNVYHSVSQKKIESYLYKLTYDLLADVVEEECPRCGCQRGGQGTDCGVLQIRLCRYDAALDRRRYEGGLQRACAAAEYDAARQYLKCRPEF